MLPKNIIKQCSVVLTHGCNLRCNFCYVKSMGYIEDDIIKYDELKKLLIFVVKQK